METIKDFGKYLKDNEIPFKKFEGLILVENQTNSSKNKNEGVDSGLYGYEPFFKDVRQVCRIRHEQKIIFACHGYFAPHKYGKIVDKYAESIGYDFY